MAVKKIGISRELIIHPGETIADILEDRGITQTELASRTGVSAAYISNIIAGKKGISANFAMGLEYALGGPKSYLRRVIKCLFKEKIFLLKQFRHMPNHRM